MEGHINGKTVAPDMEISEKAADGKTVKTANPAYEDWFARDQQIMGFCQQLEEGKEESEQGRGSRAGGTGSRRILVAVQNIWLQYSYPPSVAEANSYM